MVELAKAQVKLEIGMKSAGVHRFHKNNQRAIDAGNISETYWNKRIIQSIIEPMADAIRAYIDYYSNRRGKPVKALAYIKLLEPETAAFITLKCILDSKEDTLSTVTDKIAQRIEDQVRFSHMETHAAKYTKKLRDQLKKARSRSYRHQKNVMVAGERKLAEPNDDFEPIERWEAWTIDIHRHIGSLLVGIAVENVTFEGHPVFQKINMLKTSVAGKSGKYKEVTKLVTTEYVCEWIEKYKAVMEEQAPAYRPCVIPPRDWTTPTDGGYHLPEIRDTLPLVKCRKSQLRRLTIDQMPIVYEAINGLQRIPWQISQEVLKVAQDIKALGLDLAMPSKEPYEIPPCPIPPELEGVRGKDLKAFLTDSQWEDFIGWRRLASTLHTKDNKRKAKYLAVYSTIATAEIYKDFEEFYFVYTLDSRGRVYAKSNAMSPQGDDLQKGLIKFAKGKPLGEEGKHWLAVAGAGKWGYDKVSFDERVKFIDEMTEDIRDFVVDPLTNRGWAGADKPWQFLNWCFEWAKLADWEEDGKDARDFISYIPCAQDGSCSGLQHYSAMLRDSIGGGAVNLIPGSKPEDIYARVAALLESKLKDIAETGTYSAEFTSRKDGELIPLTESYLSEIAIGLLSIHKGINRSMSKSPTMTKTYGSTFSRCMATTSDYFVDLQTKENGKAKAEMREPIPVHPFKTPGEEGIKLYEAEKVCSKVLWDALNETVTAAVDAMQFIQRLAGYMTKAGCHMEWETMTGFIVEHKEFEWKSRRIKTQLLGNTRFSVRKETKNYDLGKMKSASSPNFVHSMDASHLILAVKGFLDAGFTGIAVIHDDFGTHACDTPKLREILRETLVSMYSEHDVLADLLEHNEALLLDEIDIPLPEKGNLDLKETLKSEYAFG